MATNGKLSAKQKRGLDALLKQGTVRAAAAETGIGERTLYRWTVEDATFQGELRKHQSAVLDETGRALNMLARGSIMVYRDLLQSNDERVRLRTADSVLGHLLRIRETVDIEQRLTDLEAIIDAQRD